MNTFEILSIIGTIIFGILLVTGILAGGGFLKLPDKSIKEPRENNP